MQTVYTVLILLLVVGGTRLAAQLIPLPLPLIRKSSPLRSKSGAPVACRP